MVADGTMTIIIVYEYTDLNLKSTNGKEKDEIQPQSPTIELSPCHSFSCPFTTK